MNQPPPHREVAWLGGVTPGSPVCVSTDQWNLLARVDELPYDVLLFEAIVAPYVEPA